MLLIKWGDICCLRVEIIKGDGKRIKRQWNWAPVVNMLLHTLQNAIHLLVVTAMCVCEISGLSYSVVEAFTLLRCYTVYKGSWLLVLGQSYKS